MVDAGGPWSVRKCPGMALAELCDVIGLDRSGEEDQLYAFHLPDGVYLRTTIIKEVIVPLKLEELSDVDISDTVPSELQTIVLIADPAFADPVQQTGWLICLKISSPYVVTGKEH